MYNELAKRILGAKDFDGYKFEMGNASLLKSRGFGNHLVYHNPKSPRSWKRKKGVGVDKVFKVGDRTFYVEESFCSKDYYYRHAWFEKSRLPRFRGYPNDKFHDWIVLTNRPRNFSPVMDLAEQYNIRILDPKQLISLIVCSMPTPPSFGIKNSGVDTLVIGSELDELLFGSNSLNDTITVNSELINSQPVVNQPVKPLTNNNVYACQEVIQFEPVNEAFRLLNKVLGQAYLGYG